MMDEEKKAETTEEETIERIHPDDVDVIEKEERDEEDISSAEMAAKLKDDLKKAVSMATKSASKSLTKVGKEAGKTAKEVAKTAGEKAAKVKEETVKVAKDTMEKVKKECKTEFYIQYQGREVKEEMLIERIKQKYEAQGHESPVTSVKVYVKLEDGCAYYVINEESTGQISL